MSEEDAPYDFAYVTVMRMAQRMRLGRDPELRARFRDLLLKVSEAMQAVEWEDAIARRVDLEAETKMKIALGEDE